MAEISQVKKETNTEQNKKRPNLLEIDGAVDNPEEGYFRNTSD